MYDGPVSLPESFDQSPHLGHDGGRAGDLGRGARKGKVTLRVDGEQGDIGPIGLGIFTRRTPSPFPGAVEYPQRPLLASTT